MKVFVDEMPKNCDKCEICKLKLGCCNTEFSNTNGKNERHSNCPLQSLADNDKEVRKQVCDEIRKKSECCDYEDNFDKVYYAVDCDILDQIEKGSDGYGK